MVRKVGYKATLQVGEYITFEACFLRKPSDEDLGSLISDLLSGEGLKVYAPKVEWSEFVYYD